MEWVEDRIEWMADGKPVQIGLTRAGSGPGLFLLPALSSVSTCNEMWPLQERLAGHYSTVAIDWPGFGDLPRPKVDWLAELFALSCGSCCQRSHGPRSQWRRATPPATRWRRWRGVTFLFRPCLADG